MNTLKVSETFFMTNRAFHTKGLRQLVSMGGSRSSKSYSILQMFLIELITRKNIKITCWRNTKVVCRATIMEDFQRIIRFDPKIWKNFKENKQAGSFTYMPTGSRIIFEGADNVGKVIGGQQTISFFNEVTEFSKEVYLQITQRTSDRVVADYNPSKDFWMEEYRHDSSTKFIRTNFKNNAFCPPNIVKQLLSYEPWESESYDVVGSEIFYKGKPISQTNQPPLHKENIKKGTANKFMWLVYGLGIGSEKPNKIYHGWREITNEHFESLEYTSYFGMDFGTASPTACSEIKYDGNGAIYIREVLYTPLSEIADSLGTVVKTRVKQLVPGKHYVVGDSAKKAYIDILQSEGYLAIPADKSSGSIEAGISIIQSLTVYFVPSKNLDFEYANYSWQVDKMGKPTDVVVKKDDHLMDSIRYCVSFLYTFLSIKV